MSDAYYFQQQEALARDVWLVVMVLASPLLAPAALVWVVMKLLFWPPRLLLSVVAVVIDGLDGYPPDQVRANFRENQREYWSGEKR
jgi:hypothetical protein